jgi:hypothetical protein
MYHRRDNGADDSDSDDSDDDDDDDDDNDNDGGDGDNDGGDGDKDGADKAAPRTPKKKKDAKRSGSGSGGKSSSKSNSKGKGGGGGGGGGGNKSDDFTTLVAVGGGDGTIALWSNCRVSALLIFENFFGGKSSVTDVCWLPSGRGFVACGSDGGGRWCK